MNSGAPVAAELIDVVAAQVGGAAEGELFVSGARAPFFRRVASDGTLSR
jgi:hypothetical protein